MFSLSVAKNIKSLQLLDIFLYFGIFIKIQNHFQRVHALRPSLSLTECCKLTLSLYLLL